MTDLQILELVDNTPIPNDCLGLWETTKEEDNYYNSIIEELGIEF